MHGMEDLIEELQWYQPTFSTDVSGKRVRVSKYPKGCLYDRNINYCPKTAVSFSSKHIDHKISVALAETASEEIIFAPAAEEEYEAIKSWLRHHDDDWEVLRQKWSELTPYRLNEIKTLPDRTIDNILSEYPALRNPQGYSLIQSDFKYKFSGKEDSLFEYWKKFREHILPAFEADIANPGGRALLKHLLNDDINEDSQDCLTFVLLVYILPTSKIFFKDNIRWKPSFAESREACVMHVKCFPDIETRIGRLNIRYSEKKQPKRPFIVVVGLEIVRIEEYLVYFGDVYYRFHSFQKALDMF
ncbi:uncharacterized protein LOC131679472 [Topomyia yanbarensis]|uniref:uncharacterized protein LOC131679472 n=1 Tax=Topomyia yanbarensis TaxID=2498891 RepID=UPI00273AD999|nr:uncharacterized protein LOC131679472 [Topomyia yanbarensis]